MVLSGETTEPFCVTVTAQVIYDLEIQYLSVIQLSLLFFFFPSFPFLTSSSCGSDLSIIVLSILLKRSFALK